MTEGEARALWIMAPGRAEIAPAKIAPVNTDPAGTAADSELVQVRSRYSAISRGTESLVFRGQVPPSEYQRMRAPFQEGEFPGPLKYGYANVGVIEAGPSQWLGQTVFCLYPHQTVYQVPVSAVLPLPAEVTPELAVLAANMETAINGLWDAAPLVGDRIAVVGGGVVGALVAYLAGRIPGTRVQLVDSNPDRVSLARRLGAEFALPDQARPDNDLVIHASGAPAGLTTALELAGQEARIIEMSWFGQQPVSIPLGGAFHARRLTLRSSQVGTVSPAQAPRWGYRDRLGLAISLLDDPVLACLISGESAFDDLPSVLAQLSDNPAGALCHRIRYF